MPEFTKEDYKDFERRGISVDLIEKQLLQFREGFPFLQITKPATPSDGILRASETTLNDFIQLYDSRIKDEKALKFVPASGAATRMFKDLYTYLEKDVSDSGNKTVNDFISGLPRFAFYDDLKFCLENRGFNLESLINSGDYLPVIKCLLDENGLNYGFIPKGLLAFHRYKDGTRTAFEEHLTEGALYCKGNNDFARIHFTISPEHEKEFTKVLHEVKEYYEKKYKLRLLVDFSSQEPSTDTIAVDAGNNPFRDNNGRLVFRPGGHGALLNNLAALDADIIFIKNIDNVVPDNLKDETIKYKKALGGMLLSFRDRIFYYLKTLNVNLEDNNGWLEEIRIFLEDELCIASPRDIDQWDKDEIRKYLISKLNRPVRICGMVRNAGEPGGGPFWVKNSDGSVSLQIVESSQINVSNPLMKKLFNASTFFNPVDLVCSIKNYQGKKHNIIRFRDPNTGFISTKFLEGRKLKALELPGLWNGAMADWNTVFVEVPLSTFNPVKTVNDLLRPQHLNNNSID